ncbi:hypothetical protein KM176_06020 [Pseudooceanicola sp. CBS1P-1]|uniref:DUF2946 domain-containing protein n=1 Tax=Pseudooceanicola albus TaxID=2692189 RepID=A0A6L7FYA3_9RHOB|nr:MULTISPECIES: hypothetical protein [Pseudooceanicola]MBT9383408.1 hypothetical protein [Pseudooceanicola endophyticus]MXN16270.1 hypothetical protein [Pseudooceanicola albus]
MVWDRLGRYNRGMCARSLPRLTLLLAVILITAASVLSAARMAPQREAPLRLAALLEGASLCGSTPDKPHAPCAFCHLLPAGPGLRAPADSRALGLLPAGPARPAARILPDPGAGPGMPRAPPSLMSRPQAARLA